jgi:hypothetical protein
MPDVGCAGILVEDTFCGHRIAQEEIFGPVVSVLTFKDEDEAIKLANSTIYGLSAILWTMDMGRAYRMTQAIPNRMYRFTWARLDGARSGLETGFIRKGLAWPLRRNSLV